MSRTTINYDLLTNQLTQRAGSTIAIAKTKTVELFGKSDFPPGDPNVLKDKGSVFLDIFFDAYKSDTPHDRQGIRGTLHLFKQKDDANKGKFQFAYKEVAKFDGMTVKDVALKFTTADDGTFTISAESPTIDVIASIAIHAVKIPVNNLEMTG